MLQELSEPAEKTEEARKLPIDYQPSMMISDPDKGFTNDEMLILTKHKLHPPSQVFMSVRDKTLDWDDYIADVGKLMQKIGSKKGGLTNKINSKSQKMKPENSAKKINKLTDEFDQLTEERKTIQNYKKRILVVPEGLETITTGKGNRQPKRNAYKTKNGNYGGLMIDYPKFMNEMKLNAYRGGKLVYQSDVDKSLINLLTKRFNPKTKYSINAVRIFNDLNSLANMPKHRSSGKSRTVGSGVTYYNDPKELLDRMKILIGSMAAGNNSPVLRYDLSLINDELLKIQAIDKTLHEKFHKKIYNK